MFNLNSLTRLLLLPRAYLDQTFGVSSWLGLAVFICCACVAGCDLTPNVLFVADGSPLRLLQLTDALGECPAPSRVCFLAMWDGEVARGCWMREEVNVRVILSEEERTVPVADFRPTAYAEYRHAVLNQPP